MTLGFDVYSIYVGLKTHFKTDYDYVKFNGKIKNITQSSFNARKDQRIFEHIANKFPKREYVPLILSNLLASEGDYYIADRTLEDMKKIFYQWKNRYECLVRTFKDDIIHLNITALKKELNFADIFKIDNNHPIILKKLISRDIAPETVIILNDINNFFDYFDKKMPDDIIWCHWRTILTKYNSFLRYDKATYLEILKEELV